MSDTTAVKDGKDRVPALLKTGFSTTMVDEAYGTAETETTETPTDVSDNNYIHLDGEPVAFGEGGAVRADKHGKGRYDLIPSTIICDVITHVSMVFDDIMRRAEVSQLKSLLIFYAYDETYDSIINALTTFIILEYCDKFETRDDFAMGLNKALMDLAMHFEYGAEHHGADNWKKGITLTGTDRGGSFYDSGRRHLAQYLAGLTDEKHGVAFMWNFICGGWVYLNNNE